MAHDLFGGEPRGSEQPAGGDLKNTLFGGFGPTGQASGGTQDSAPSGMFGGFLGLGGYREPILPAGSQARGYGGQYFSSQGEADKSGLISGVVTDPYTGYVGTPQEIYDRYVAEGRDPRPLLEKFRRRF